MKVRASRWIERHPWWFSGLLGIGYFLGWMIGPALLLVGIGRYVPHALVLQSLAAVSVGVVMFIANGLYRSGRLSFMHRDRQ